MNGDTKIIKMVQNLLAKADNTTNEHEKMLFYKKAQEFIVAHDLLMTDIEGYTKEEINTAYSDWVEMRFKDWIWTLGEVVAENHNCIYFRNDGSNDSWNELTGKWSSRSKYRMNFVGVNEKPTIATYTYNSLLMLLKPKSVSYRLGFLEGLKKEYAKTWETYSIVPVVPKSVKDYKNTLEIKSADPVKKQEVTDIMQYETGYRDGKRYTYQKVDSTNSQIKQLGNTKCYSFRRRKYIWSAKKRFVDTKIQLNLNQFFRKRKRGA